MASTSSRLCASFFSQAPRVELVSSVPQDRTSPLGRSRLASCFGQCWLIGSGREVREVHWLLNRSFRRGRTIGCRDFRVKARQFFFAGLRPGSEVLETVLPAANSTSQRSPRNPATSRRLRENHSARESRGVRSVRELLGSRDGRPRCF